MKNLGLTLMICLFTTLSFGQLENSTKNTEQGESTNIMEPIREPVDKVYKQIHLSQYKPMEYAPLREADVLWSQLIWSVIDLREKMNHPMYFPTEKKGNWKSLMQAILDATTDTTEGNPNPLRVYDDEYLTIPYTMQGIRENTGTMATIPIIDPDYGDIIGDSSIFVSWGTKEVFQYMLKYQYFIDKQRSVKDERLLYVAPMFWYEPLTTGAQTESSSYEESDGEGGDEDMPTVSSRKWRRFGYLYFKEMRPMLATTEIFNPQNNAQRRTYDDIFVQEHYSSFIRAEENVHDNRNIFEYTVNGMDQRLEGDKIKEKIRTREHEMWEY